MAISFQCGGCGKQYQVANHLAGEQVNCTACEAVMTVPAAGAEVAPAEVTVVEEKRGVQDFLAPPPRSGVLPKRQAGADRAVGFATPQAVIVEPSPVEPPPRPSLGVPGEGEIVEMQEMNARVNASRVKRSRVPRLALSDGTARLISGLLLIGMLIGGAWVGHQLVGLVEQSGRIPEGLKDRFHTFLFLFAARELVFFFILIVPTILIACALAANWTEWELPDGAYLRAAGTASLPFLFVIAFAFLAVRRELLMLAAFALVTPFLLVIGLKELMGLKWSTTLVAALLLLVFFPVEGLLRKTFERQLNAATLSMARLDPDSLKQWADEHPEEAQAARDAASLSEAMAAGRRMDGPPSGFANPSRMPRPSIPADVPDPLTEQLAGVLGELHEATTAAPRQTREQIQRARDALAARVAAFKPAANIPSRSWYRANDALEELARQAAIAPSEAPPPSLLSPIEDHPLGVAKVDDTAFAAETFAFKTIRLRPLKTSKIDLAGFEERQTCQRWLLKDRDGLLIQLSIEPLRDARQLRPWVGERRIIGEVAEQKNLFPLVLEGKLEELSGRVGTLAWTRVVKRNAFNIVDEAIYAARLPDGWLLLKLKTRHGETDDVALADRFIQGIHVATAGESGADPYDIERVVERFGDKWDDPSNIIRAAGPKGVDVLMAYVARFNGINVPGRAQGLLMELTRSNSRTTKDAAASVGPLDVAVALITLKTSRDVSERQYVMQRLAKTTPDEHRNEVAAALEEIMLGRDADFLAEDAGNALAVWWRPQTSAAILPLLDERVWPPAKRDAAIKVLGRTGDKLVAPAIVRWIIKAPDQAVAALKDMGPAAEESVIPLLHYADGSVRANAARILDAIGTNKCLIDLRHAANDPRDPLAAAVARGALEKVLERTRPKKAAPATTNVTGSGS